MLACLPTQVTGQPPSQNDTSRKIHGTEIQKRERLKFDGIAMRNPDLPAGFFSLAFRIAT
jgi:hypothetical protein